MGWWTERMVGFDLETTSPEPEEARIVSAAVAICGGGQPTEMRTWLADPGVPIPDEAAEVHGITTERARAEGRPVAEVVREVVAALDAVCVPAPLVVFNARYDLTVLDRELRRHTEDGSLDDLMPLRVIDPLVIDKWLDRYRKGSRKLEAICSHYGATLDAAHDADSDAVAAARAAWVLGAKGVVTRKVWNEEMGREKAALVREWEGVRFDLDLLTAAQVGWAREQAVGLAEYFREQRAKGEEETGDPDGVRVEWPVIPFEGPAS